MLMPKKTKYRKVHRGRLKGLSKGARSIQFGDYGLVALEPSWVTARQLEAVRITVGRKLKKIGTSYIRMFPNKSVTKKPAETRMGKGKGNPDFWVCPVKRGRVILEIAGDFNIEDAKKILQAASYKLPMKTRFVSKDHVPNASGVLI